MKCGAHFSPFAVLLFLIKNVGLTERHFQSPAERSRINLMFYNRACLITWDCASDIN